MFGSLNVLDIAAFTIANAVVGTRYVVGNIVAVAVVAVVVLAEDDVSDAAAAAAAEFHGGAAESVAAVALAAGLAAKCGK